MRGGVLPVRELRLLNMRSIIHSLGFNAQVEGDY